MASLMLHRDVLTGFGRLPAKVQKKVSELIRKFQEDMDGIPCARTHRERTRSAAGRELRSMSARALMPRRVAW